MGLEQRRGTVVILLIGLWPFVLRTVCSEAREEAAGRLFNHPYGVMEAQMAVWRSREKKLEFRHVCILR